MDHEGEYIARQIFGVEGFHDFHAGISPSVARFVESLPCFFIATANRPVECDYSFRGREYDAAGRPCAPLKALDANTLLFPDYRGNGLFHSLGNILVNGQISMLFINFESRRRARNNGRAHVV